MISATSALLSRRFQRIAQLTSSADRDGILNVFNPNSPTTTPAKFAGRDYALEKLIDALIARGADVVVFGERGSGKSSLANMLHDIARGNLEVLDYYDGLRERLEAGGRLEAFRRLIANALGKRKSPFDVIWVDGFGRPVDDVIHEALTRHADQQHGTGILSYLPLRPDRIEIARKFGVGVQDVFSAEEQETLHYEPEKPKNVKEAFIQATQQYAKAYSDSELLIVIDEVEEVLNRADFATYLKSAQRTRFVLVGIADTAIELLGKHASVARDTHTINLQPMTDDELGTILEIGLYILARFCKVSPDAIAEVVTRSMGSPFWCHFLARSLIQSKMDSSTFADFVRGTERVINRDDVVATIAALSTAANAGLFEEALQQLTRGNERIATVVLAIAKQPTPIISSERVAESLAGRPNLSREIVEQAIADLLQMPGIFENRGKVLDVVTFSFLDPNFKRYIILRNAGMPALA